MNQKGMEMAVQIFIVLFVLLAVAMLVLQMVGQQFTTQTAKLEEQQRLERIRTQKAAAKSACDELCSQGGTDSYALFCMKNFSFVPEGFGTMYNNTDFVPGIGVCEDRVYCNQLTTCKVGTVQLNMDRCTNILCDYWSNQGVADADLDAKLREFMKPGKCWDASLTDTDKENHWFTYAFDSNADGTIDDDKDCTAP